MATLKQPLIDKLNKLPDQQRVIYVAYDCGEDGCQPRRPFYAAFKKDDLRTMMENDRGAHHRVLDTETIDPSARRKQALAKLDGIDRLVLGLPNWTEEH